MTEYILINSSEIRMPKAFIKQWLEEVCSCLRKKKIFLKKKQSLTVIFLNRLPAKAINFQYRKKNYATDILSFDGDGVESLGELVLCPEILQRQAVEHDLSFRQELGYMLIHGVLHLLGYDHEKNQEEAQEMFQLQDEIFDQLCQSFWS
jgi:probable rRNA maturation factor